MKISFAGRWRGQVAALALMLVLLVATAPLVGAAPKPTSPKPLRPYNTCAIQVDRVLATTGWLNDSGNGLTNASLYSTIVGRVDINDGTYCDHLYGQTAIRFNQSGAAQCATPYTIVYTWNRSGGIAGNGPYTQGQGCGSSGHTVYASGNLLYVPASAWCKAENVGYGNAGFYHGTTLAGIYWNQFLQPAC